MTKADLVEEVSKVTELTRKDSEVIVDTLFDSVIKALKSGDMPTIKTFFDARLPQLYPAWQVETVREIRGLLSAAMRGRIVG